MSVDPALAVAVLLTAAVAVVDWVAVARGDRRTRRWAKPGVLVGLLAVALALGAADTTTARPNANRPTAISRPVTFAMAVARNVYGSASVTWTV